MDQKKECDRKYRREPFSMTKLLFIANALRGYHIGLDEEADGVWSI